MMATHDFRILDTSTKNLLLYNNNFPIKQQQNGMPIIVKTLEIDENAFEAFKNSSK